MGDQSHTFHYEQGGSAALGGIHPRTVPSQVDGSLLLADIERALRTDDQHFPTSRLIILENKIQQNKNPSMTTSKTVSQSLGVKE